MMLMLQRTLGHVSRNSRPLAHMVRQKHTLPDLPYDYNALEPVISTDIMRLHHSKHHQAYVNNLNVFEEKLAEATHKNDVQAMIQLQSGITFNGGGHLIHSMFWTNLSPTNVVGGQPPTGDLMQMIQTQYGSLEKFIQVFNGQTAAVQGSGWGWLGYDPATNTLKIATTLNHDLLQVKTGLVPLLVVDVWEHGYYLDYKNARPDYLQAIWQVINWKNAEERLAEARLTS